VRKDFNRRNSNNNANDFIIGTGRDSIFGIATRYRLDVLGFESRWGARGETFRTRPDRRGGPLRLLYDAYLFSFPGVKWPGRVVNRPPHLSPRFKKE
jgi:hypothetical protein